MAKRDRVEATRTSTVEQDVLRDLVLNTEKMTIKFDKYIIIRDKAINGKELLANVWDMKDIVQFKR